MSGDIFISYRRSDQAKAHLLHALLKERGVDAWYDTQVGVGEDWRRATAKALDVAPIFVLLFSKSASESAEIGKELAAATFSKKLAIPVRLEDIRPSGEFLYELASRNWFDAFEQTEARFEILADKLAALVKGGAGADVAALDLGAAQPAKGPALQTLRRRPAMVGGLAAAALALGAAVAVFATRPQASPPSAAPTSQLIAFFSFTPTGDEPAVKATAEAATDRMFQVMGGANFLSTVARTETRGTPEERRFARAAELGAHYALGGEIRPDADGMTLSIRFEDVSSRLTLWEKSFSAHASDVAYLPAQAARQTAEVMWCIVKTRSELTRDSSKILNLIAGRCREGAAGNTRNVTYIVGRMRAVTEADPRGAYNQAQLVMMLGLGAFTAPASARAAWIAEAEAALQRAVTLDPEEPGVQLARVILAYAKLVPMAEWDAITLDAVAKSEGKDAFVFGDVSYFRSRILGVAGRFRDALPHMATAVAYDPLPAPWEVGRFRAMTGQRSEARAELEPALAAYGPWAWTPIMPYAIFLDAADADAMLRSPPSTIPKATVDCLRVIRDALASQDPGVRALGAAKARACGDAETLNPMTMLASLAALDDLGAAFALADKQTFNASSLWTETLQVLFWPTSRAMRADPRFLPLVEKLGMMDYWRATKSQPDVCETETAPFCAALSAR